MSEAYGIELKQRTQLIRWKRCCGLCPHMLAASTRSLLECEVVCAAAEDGAVCPKKHCTTFDSLTPADRVTRFPQLIALAIKQGMTLSPPAAFAA